jgi:hypothetical protein
MTLSPIERLGISTKPQAIGITGELIDKQLDAHCVAKRPDKFGKLKFGGICQ